MYRKIIYATNFSESCGWAFEQAVELAKKYSATLYLCHYVESPYKLYRQFVYTTPGSTEALGFMSPEVRRAYLSHVQKLYLSKVKDFDKIETVVEPGHAHVEILRLARKIGADLIVMGMSSEKKEPMTIGNNLEQVVRRARCPVMVVSSPTAFTMADRKAPLRDIIRAGGGR
jgi:nucleotide-binding universal stress UspA family protein